MGGSVAALFQRLTQGVYVVGVAHGEVRNAFTAAFSRWICQWQEGFRNEAIENRSAAKRKASDLQGMIRRQLARFRSDHMVDFRYDSGSFSHSRRNALGGARPHIADGEDTGPAGLKR